MIYLLLAYILGQIAYHHVLSAIFIGIILLVSMMIKQRRLFFICAACAVCLLGYIVESYMLSQPNELVMNTSEKDTEMPVHMSVHIETVPIKKETYFSAVVRAHNEKYHLIFGGFRQDTQQYDAHFWATHVCPIDATIKPPNESAQFPTLFAKQLDMGQCTSKDDLTLTERIVLARNIAIEHLIRGKIPGYPYIIALVTGTTDYIASEEKQALQALGISHLFAVSGTHVAILTGLFYTIGKRLPIPLYIIQLLLLAVLPLFLIFSGNSPSAQRAVVMACLVIIFARWFQFAALHILLISYILLSIVTPTIHHHIGFQFSYAICFLLITLRQTYAHQHFFRALFTTSFIATVATIPISYQHFNELQWLGLLSNLFFIPLYGLCIIPLSFLATFIALVSPSLLAIFTIPFYLLFNIHDLLIKLMRPLTYWKLIIPSLGECGYFMLIVFVTLFAYLLAKQQRRLLILFVTILLLVIIFYHPQYTNRMTVIDVGQGDAILFETKTGETLLIDTGGKREHSKQSKNHYSITDQKLYPFLKEQGIRKIDYLVITHPHADHMGEIAHLAKRVNILNIIINPNHFDEPYRHLVKKVAFLEDAHLLDYHQLPQLQLGDFSFQFLNSDIQESEDPNEHSIVTLATIHQTHILLMGDATTENEEKLMASYTLPRVDILKVGHHGSKTSSSETFLEATQPKLALISVAKHNMYHLPSPTIIERFRTKEIPIYSTATNHHIIINFDLGRSKQYTVSSQSNH